MKKNTTYLIQPKYEKDLYEKLYRACSRYKVKRCSVFHANSGYRQVEKMDQKEEGVFKPVKLGSGLSEL
jgi:hypothetical protein